MREAIAQARQLGRPPRGTVDVGDVLGDVGGVAAERGGRGKRQLSRRRRARALGGQPDDDASCSARAAALTVGYEHLRDDRTADRGIPARDGRPFETDPRTFFGNAEQSHARSDRRRRLRRPRPRLQRRNAAEEHLPRDALRQVLPERLPRQRQRELGRRRRQPSPGGVQQRQPADQRLQPDRPDVQGHDRRASSTRSSPALEVGHQDSSNKRNTGFFGPLATDTLVTVAASAPFATAVRFQPNGSDADNNVRADIARPLRPGPGRPSRPSGSSSRACATTASAPASTTSGRRWRRPTWRGPTTALSPRLGILWSPNAASTYYASYSRSFLPSGEQLSLAPNTADLAPEKATQLRDRRTLGRAAAARALGGDLPPRPRRRALARPVEPGVLRQDRPAAHRRRRARRAGRGHAGRG